MIKEAITSLSGTIRERLSNPFLGAFILSWAVINWRILYTIFRPLDTAETTIQAVDSHGSLWTCLVGPAIIAVVYVTTYPWIKYGIFYIQSVPIQKQKMLQFQWEKTVLTAKSSVLNLEADMSLIRVRNEIRIEIEKLEAQDHIEETKHDRQYQREQLQIERENARRQQETILEVKKLELEHQRRIQEIHSQGLKNKQNG